MKLTDDEKAVIALATRLGDPGRQSLSTGRWHALARSLRDEGLSPSDLFFGRLPSVSADDRKRIEELLADAASVLMTASELSHRGFWITTLESEDYPSSLRETLGTQAPPVLFGAGARELLAERGIGIVGSRQVGEEGASVAIGVAQEAVRLGYLVVSGAARGVDQLAMNSAYRSGGGVIGVLADSLTQRVKTPEIRGALEGGRTLLITQQNPEAPFSAAAAMARNKLVYALSRLTVVVAADLETGGTWAGATEALKHSYGRVVVYRGPGEGRGNGDLERLGVQSFSGTDELAAILEEGSAPSPVQLALDDS
ncbi:MAG TPA: DNA-processing protein DprA [Acidimicrobiia bacterium]|nr:DNA-processing protein DprA [Acidimicrobiia bacterium]